MIKAEVIGNLGANAIVKNINGQDFVSFDIASTEKRKNANGVDVETTTWISVLMRGDGGALTQYLTKGSTVFVRGDLRVSAYMDRSNQAQASASVYVSEIRLCGSKNK